MKVVCSYCNQDASLVKGNKIYPHRKDLSQLNFWYCANGHEAAYVGCHAPSVKHSHTGTEPLGRLANKKLRYWKSQAHRAFDPLWKEGKRKYFKSRKKAYNWLADVLNLEPEECHIGMFDIYYCKRVIEVCNGIG